MLDRAQNQNFKENFRKEQEGYWRLRKIFTEKKSLQKEGQQSDAKESVMVKKDKKLRKMILQEV